MKNRMLFFLVMIPFLTVNAQVKFDEGYFINNDGIKTKCLIKNLDWRINPEKFEYKIRESGIVKTASIDTVKEFGIEGIVKYERYEVEIERAVDKIELLTNNKNPVFKKEKLFLKVLVEGKASLFVFNDDKNVFFIKDEILAMRQLVYKRYLYNDDKQIAENFEFRRQLNFSLKCAELSDANFSVLNYDLKELVAIFKKYNTCVNHDYVEYEKSSKKDLFNFNIRPGITYSSLEIGNRNSNNDYAKFENKATIRLGAEAEFVLGFNNNKWSIPVAIDYQYFKATATSVNSGLVEADLKSLNGSIGIRYNFFLKSNSKLFVNGIFNYYSYINPILQYQSKQPLDIPSSQNMLFGIGLKKNKCILEYRYELARDLLYSYKVRYSTFGNMSLTFGYALF